MESTSNHTVANSDMNTVNIKNIDMESIGIVKKAMADHDLKNSIIEFMRVRPFLWNCRDPSYKDHKRREQEFQEFSNQIEVPVREIKRVWHVLRTNFFRAHKLLLERPNLNHSGSGGGGGVGIGTGGGENGSERLWKYYLAMEYILGGVNNGNSDDSQHVTKQAKSKDCKTPRDGRPSVSTKPNHRELNNSAKSCKMTSSSGASLNNNFTSINKPTLPTNDFPTSSSMESDDDHLYARSLTSSLKKFDPTTREIIKLKFQQIIVSYMRQQSLSLQTTNEATTNSDMDEDVTLFNSK